MEELKSSVKNQESTLRAIGRRKEARARAILTPEGKGTIMVNGKDFRTYFPVGSWQEAVLAPLQVANVVSAYDIQVSASGGGKHGQADSVKLAIARALLASNADLRLPFRAAGLLTRDPRAKERRKFGLKKARKAPQWSKR